MKILDHRVDGDAALLTTSTGRLKIEAVGERVMRVVFTARDSFGDQTNGMLLSG